MDCPSTRTGSKINVRTTNAIAAASALYLDIINIFLRVLRILARSRSND